MMTIQELASKKTILGRRVADFLSRHSLSELVSFTGGLAAPSDKRSNLYKALKSAEKKGFEVYAIRGAHRQRGTEGWKWAIVRYPASWRVVEWPNHGIPSSNGIATWSDYYISPDNRLRQIGGNSQGDKWDRCYSALDSASIILLNGAIVTDKIVTLE